MTSSFSAKPFIDRINVFSVLLSGAQLSCLWMVAWGPAGFGADYADLTAGTAWAILFIFMSLRGYLVLPLGGLLDTVYDWFRRLTLKQRIVRVVSECRWPSWVSRVCAPAFFLDERDFAVSRRPATRAVGTFQSAKSVLLPASAESLPIVQRSRRIPIPSAASRSSS